MRVVLGVLGLLIVVAVVGVLAKKQLKPVSAAPIQVQSQQIQQQFKQAVEAGMQPRAVPGDEK